MLHLNPNIARLMAAALLASASAGLYAQSTIGDPTPVLGNGVTGAAANAQMNSALGAHAKCAKNKSCAAANAKSEAQQRNVNTLITQYHGCRRRAADVASSPAQRDALRMGCVREYDPKFAKSCVGAANSIAICERYRSRGTIERP
jgi:hypothetical protein